MISPEKPPPYVPNFQQNPCKFGLLSNQRRVCAATSYNACAYYNWQIHVIYTHIHIGIDPFFLNQFSRLLVFGNQIVSDVRITSSLCFFRNTYQQYLILFVHTEYCVYSVVQGVIVVLLSNVVM